MTNEVLILTGTGAPDADHRIDKKLAHLEGFEVSVSVTGDEANFPYRLGKTCFFKVLDPEERQDCDRDRRAWRSTFTVTDVQVMESALIVTGISGFGLDTISIHECDDDHLPWEHDGMCDYGPELKYKGPVQLALYQWGQPKPRSYEFDTVLGGSIDTLLRVKAELAE